MNDAKSLVLLQRMVLRYSAHVWPLVVSCCHCVSLQKGLWHTSVTSSHLQTTTEGQYSVDCGLWIQICQDMFWILNACVGIFRFHYLIKETHYTVISKWLWNSVKIHESLCFQLIYLYFHSFKKIIIKNAPVWLLYGPLCPLTSMVTTLGDIFCDANSF